MVILSSILNYLRLQREYRSTRQQLHALDDHLLRDIGLRRDQIDAMALELHSQKTRLAEAEASARRHGNTRGSAFGGTGLAPQH